MNKFKQACEVFDAIIENYEHIAECSVKDTLNNMPIDDGISAIKEALAIAERMVWQPIDHSKPEKYLDRGWFALKQNDGEWFILDAILHEESLELTDHEYGDVLTQYPFKEYEFYMPIPLPETKGLEDE